MQLILSIALLIAIFCCTLAENTNVENTESISHDILKLGAEGLIKLAKQTVLGGPFVLGFEVVSKLCATLLRENVIRPRITPNISKMEFQLRTASCRNISVPLSRAEELWKIPEFIHERETVIFITGWKSTIQSESIDEMSKAYTCRNNVNFVALDAANYVDTLYTWSALNTNEIGRYVAIGLEKLEEIGYDIGKVHLIGHSLGAQIVGSAGRYYQQKTQRRLTRITGLDPANPCFYDEIKLPGLQASDADFVDVIHTNPNALGTDEAVADADYFANGNKPLQPGCFDISCSHSRSVKYYIESVYPNNIYNFPAIKCDTMENLNANKCLGQKAIMGYAATSENMGIYTLKVNRRAPFGKNATSIFQAVNNQCGYCHNEL